MKSEFVVIAVVVSVLAVAVLLVLWLQKPDPLAVAVVEGLAERQVASAPPAVPPPAPLAVQSPAPARPLEPMSASLLFGFDRAELGTAEAAKLDRLLAGLHAKAVRVEAIGHADRIGPEAYNLRLSQRRADAVKAYLVKKEIDPGAVRTSAKGEREPVSGDACVDMGPQVRRNVGLVECLQPDRRVELTVLGAI